MQPCTVVGECRSTIVLPAVAHPTGAEGLKISEFGAFFTSTLRIAPSGRRVQPSSALKSLFPFGDIALHERVVGSSALNCLVSLLPTRNFPFGSTAAGESPI